MISEAGGNVKFVRADRPNDKGFELPRFQVWSKELADGSRAVGFFNLDEKEATVTANFSDLKISGSQKVRDLWRQKDLGSFDGKYESTVPPHGVVLLKLSGQ